MNNSIYFMEKAFSYKYYTNLLYIIIESVDAEVLFEDSLKT